MGEGEQADAGSSDPRTEHGDAVGVSSEEADVLADPPQRLDLVQEPVVPFSSLVTSTEEAWNTYRYYIIKKSPLNAYSDSPFKLNNNKKVVCNFHIKYATDIHPPCAPAAYKVIRRD